jgi:hypothetical protein
LEGDVIMAEGWFKFLTGMDAPQPPSSEGFTQFKKKVKKPQWQGPLRKGQSIVSNDTRNIRQDIIDPVSRVINPYSPRPVGDVLDFVINDLGGAQDILGAQNPEELAMAIGPGGRARRGAKFVGKKAKSAIDTFIDDTPPAGIGHNSNINYYDPLKISKQYPDTGPPSQAINEKGKPFLEKELTYEAKAVSKAVKKARDEITAGDYTPFFDVSKRTYVDPKNYPASGRTQTDAVAKKQATRDKWIKEFDTPEAKARLQAGYDKAKDDPLAKDWYAVGQLEKEYIKRLGPEAGRAAFGKDFADGMAATTGGANPTANLLMTHYANFMRQAGKPLPKNAYELPYPIGGRYARTNIDQYDKLINQGRGIAAATNPKRFNFSHNFKGHRDISTLDEQMSGGFKPGMTMPPKGSYGIMEGILADLAQKNNVNPANFQDVGWAGLKGTAGKPMIQQVNEMIHRTSRATGKTPLEVLDGFIRKTMPMYGLGATGLGAYALSDEESMNSTP